MKRTIPYTLLFTAIVLFSCASKKKVITVEDAKHEYMEKTYSGLKDSLKEAQVTILRDTIKILFPENLLFKTSSTDILEETYPLMQRFANSLLTYNKTNILINGYTDNIGSDSVNSKISQQRADNSKNILVRYSVNSSRLFTWGFGPKNPIGDNSTEDGRAKNRRVEFVVLYSYK